MASRQHYGNHVFYYPPHHYVLLPLSAMLLIGCGWGAAHYAAERPIWLALTATAFLLLMAIVLLRQHYALGVQNRIVRLEMRLRYYQLTGRRFEPLEQQLTFGQIAALRFAPDEELEELISTALQENPAPDAIKQRIKNWLPDDMRV